jgi:hypothetical protein
MFITLLKNLGLANTCFRSSVAPSMVIHVELRGINHLKSMICGCVAQHIIISVDLKPGVRQRGGNEYGEMR